MNVFYIDIWYQVTRDGKFSHTVQRVQTVHAMNKEQAERKVTLKPAGCYVEHGGGKLEWSAEFIYRIEKQGTVRIVPYYEYSDERHSPRPVPCNIKAGGTP